VAALYQSAPAMLTVFAGVALYGAVARESPRSAWGLSDVWRLAIIVQSGILLLLLISGVTGSGGFIAEAGILSIRLKGSWFQIHPDLSGVMAEVGLVHFLGFARPRRPLEVVCLAVNVLVFILAQSRTAYAMAGVALLVWYVAKGRKNIWVNIWGVCILPLAGLFWSLSTQLFVRGQTAEELSGLTGRTNLWNAAYRFGSQRPFFGYGAFSGIRQDFAATFAQEFGKLEIRTLDNQFVNTFLEVGALGVLLMVAFLCFAIVGALRAVLRDPTPFRLEMLALALVFPIRAWLGQLLILYDPTQLYAIVLVLSTSLGVAGTRRSLSARPARAARARWR
jgi:O-antigen ligase